MRRIRRGTAAVVVAVGFAAFTAGCGAAGGTAGGAPATASSVAPASAPPSAQASTHAPAPAPRSVPVTSIPDGYDASRDAQADIRTALAEAAKGHREVLVDFGANWCPDCRALDVMFRSARVAPVLRRDYVVVAVDVGQFNHNIALAEQYVNLQTSGIPALVVLKPDGSVRTATDDGAFSNARTMDPDQVSAFLTRWAPAR